MDVIHPGIPGAANRWFSNQGQARRAALQTATRFGPGYTIAHDPRPSRGLPHYHVVDPNGRRVSGHFFYGRRPPRKVLRGRPWRELEAEAELELLESTGDSDAYVSELWAAWHELPPSLREWLLWVVPGRWSLPAHVFRRVLLTTAGLIVWNRLSPGAALRRAAVQLRLPARGPLRAARVLPVRRPAARRGVARAVRRGGGRRWR